MTVTTSPRKGLEPTLELAERVAGHGYSVVPHLAARHVRDRAHLADLVARLQAFGARDVLVLAGDAEEPAGDFDGSLALLRALAELGHPFRDVGITGYPESHAFISDTATIRSMYEKEEFATYIVSQICFDPQVIATWMRAVWERGTRLPIHIGLPGPVPSSRLVKICERIGVGESRRMLPDDGPDDRFDPDPLVSALAENVDEGQASLAGFHVFTFNELENTERWRRRALAAAHAGAREQ